MAPRGEASHIAANEREAAEVNGQLRGVFDPTLFQAFPPMSACNEDEVRFRAFENAQNNFTRTEDWTDSAEARSMIQTPFRARVRERERTLGVLVSLTSRSKTRENSEQVGASRQAWRTGVCG
jgi:hypothetical protein